MEQPPFEVADVLRALAHPEGSVPGLRMSAAQQRVARDLMNCRTAKLGGHVEVCDACGGVRVAYNSCRNRHCPKCQAYKRADWLEARCQDLLPVPYFHLVFTLPAEIAALALQNPRVIYNLLFQSASATLKEIAADPKHLGAEIGILAVLHTWGQTLVHHPHLHCIVPGGGLASDGSRWIASRENFFLSVRVLSRLFRGKFLAGLQAAYDRGSLQGFGSLAERTPPARFAELRAEAFKKEWVVYSKAPFGGPEAVLKYVARYTHRVALANWRIVSANAQTVTFRYKDYAQGNTQRFMKLSSVEFLRRFLLHVLPNGFMRIRYYGFLGNACRKDKIARCKELLSGPPSAIHPSPDDMTDISRAPGTETDPETKRCTACGSGAMRTLETFDPQSGWTYKYQPCTPAILDSS